MKFVQIGLAVVTARKDAGLTQAQLAKKMGICTQSISNIERGMASLPIKHIRKFLRVTGASRSYVLGEITQDFINNLNRSMK